MFDTTLLSTSTIAVKLVEEKKDFLTEEKVLLEETSLIKAKWSPVKQRTFIMGRIAAHNAVRTLGLEDIPILRGRYGIPIWGKGAVGSISHKDTIAVAIVGKSDVYQSVGIDIEERNFLLAKEEYSLFCTEEEIKSIEEGVLSGVVIFSRKEAILKALSTIDTNMYTLKDIDSIHFQETYSKLYLSCIYYKSYIVNICYVSK